MPCCFRTFPSSFNRLMASERLLVSPIRLSSGPKGFTRLLGTARWSWSAVFGAECSTFKMTVLSLSISASLNGICCRACLLSSVNVRVRMRSATLAWSRGTSIVQPRSVSSWSSLRSSNTNLSRSAALKDELLAHRLKYGVEQPGEYIQPIERIKSDKFFDGNG